MTDLLEMTPAQSIQFMLTLPWVMGDVSDEGATYDEREIETVLDYAKQIEARTDAAEADARECRAERARYGDAMTEKLAAVEADRDEAEADLARTEDLLGIAQDERDAFVFELSKSLLESQRRLEQKQDAEAERDALREVLRETRRLLLDPQFGQGKRIGQAVDFIDATVNTHKAVREFPVGEFANNDRQ